MLVKEAFGQPATEKIITLPYKPRDYQNALFDAVENKGIYKINGYRRFIAVWPRRAGKDTTCFNILIRAALRRVGTYVYFAPTFSNIRGIIWDNMLIDGFKMLDFIPEELIFSKNEQRMEIRLINGSIIKLSGSNAYDTSLRGSNPIGLIFSEFAYADERAFSLGALPIIRGNDGFVIFVSTPQGKNFFYDYYQIAKQNPDAWFISHLTVADTQHISIEEIEKDIASGIISYDKAQQEYFCSFHLGVEGAYYAKILNTMRLNGQIGNVAWDSSHPVYVACDFGVHDATSIIFFQVIGQQINIIDCYENTDKGIDYYCDYILKKPYTYAKFFSPHDGEKREQSDAIKTIDKAVAFGITFDTTDRTGLEAGIETVRALLPRMYIDNTRCKKVIDALENYRREYDTELGVYRQKPRHDKFSHMADAVRYVAVNIRKAQIGTTAEELDRRYRQAVYGPKTTIPLVFRDDLTRRLG